MVRLLNITLCFLFAIQLSAQDPQLSQFFNAPVYVNPAFVGETRQWKFTLNSRMQWMATPAEYVSNAFTAELSLPANHSGLGLQILHDQTGTGKLTYVSYSGIYSYKAYLSRRMKLNFGIKGSFNQRYFDEDELIFPTDVAGGQSENSPRSNISYPDVSAGVGLVTRAWWVGASVDHILRPDYSFSSEKSPLPIKYSIHALYKHKLKRSTQREADKSIVLATNFKSQQDWYQYELGGYFNYYGFSFGAIYRGVPVHQTVSNNINQDAVVAILGYRWLGLRIFYSYDITVSKIWNETGGSHEFAIITEYPMKPKKRKRSHRFLPCPKF